MTDVNPPCIEALGQGVLYNGFTYAQLTQKWWDFNLPIFQGADPVPQPIEGIFILEGTPCPQRFMNREIAVHVASGDKILGALANFGGIASPVDGPQYWDTYDPFLAYLGLNTSSVKALEKAVFGTTMVELGQVDTKLSLIVDGCALDATANFVQTGIWEPAVIPGIVPAASDAHHAGFYFLLPALTDGRHTIQVGVNQNGNNVLSSTVPNILPLYCNFLTTYNVCVGEGPCVADTCSAWFFLLQPICWILQIFIAIFTGILGVFGI